MFADRLRLIRQRLVYTSPSAAAHDAGITESQWNAMEAGASPIDVLEPDDFPAWFYRLAAITREPFKEYPIALMEAAGLFEEARKERGRSQGK
jgi:hypothetical protein